MQVIEGLVIVGFVLGLAWAFMLAYAMGSVNLHRMAAAWHLETAERLESRQRKQAEVILERLAKVRLP